ncbi:MAG: hypothetical protein ACK4N5_18280 [Myxococcales bacterium]
MRSVPARESGQANTEYVITLMLIAIAAIAIITFFGGRVRNLFAKSAQAVAGAEFVGEAAAGAPGGKNDQYNLNGAK